MKTLFVFRHAKAERDSDSGQDFARPLAERGWRDAESVGREMRVRGLHPDAVLASPAKRAAETVAAWHRGYGRLDPSYEPEMYNASTGRLLDILRAIDERSERLLIVGHNPGLHELLLDLTDRDEEGLRDRVCAKLPTAALAAIELGAQNWKDLKPGAGRIVELILPRGLD